MAGQKLSIVQLDPAPTLRDRIYDVLKDAIMSMNIYAPDADLRLDERQLAAQLGISRTPLREALVRIEQEGLVTIVPRRGIFVVRKTKAEIIEMVVLWAALESMAARLATTRASDDEIASLRTLFADMQGGRERVKIDEYSDRNIAFHQAILDLGKSPLIKQTAEPLFMHVRGIRARTIGDEDRMTRSIIDHMHIIEALEARDADLAERLVREHALNLAAHIDKHVNYLG